MPTRRFIARRPRALHLPVLRGQDGHGESAIRRELEHDLRHATTRGELELVYQPQQDIQTGWPPDLEALLRWKHPTRGAISPATFIPIAEETGAILDIGAWVLREACREAASWQHPSMIAINVSAVQIHNASFVQLVHQTLLDTGLPLTGLNSKSRRPPSCGTSIAH